MQEKGKVQRKCARITIYMIISILPWFIIFVIANALELKNKATGDIKIVNYEKKEYKSPVDHTKFKELKKDFKSPTEVTEACVSCHNKRHTEVMANAHWTWDRKRVRANGDTIRSGKRNVINNFCIATNSNTWKCTSCHIGYGYDGKDFDFTDYKKIDCLACHDTTGAYEKEPLGSGFPVDEKQSYANKTYFPPNYNYIATNVGKPDIENCGKCHFYGGGGNNVKHGDLSSDLYHADKDMDVHMDEHGNDMTCVDCHDTENHNMSGKLYSVSSINENRLSCEKCHEGDVHTNKTLNRHSNKIACQTCHIPEYAKGVATNTDWDWSTAGKLDESGHPIKEHDSIGNITYKTAKGTYKWGTNLEPEYMWFNGTAEQTVFGDIIEDTSKTVQLNKLFGSHDDGISKIIPVKVHRGKQIFDPVNKMLILPHIYGHDSTAYHHGLNWDISSKVGMEYAGLPYSGQYSFINTEMYWPLNHMVSPTKDALKCIDCHSKDSRLAELDGFYMPGRDRNALMDIVGVLLIMGAFGGVLIHAVIRFIRKKHIV